MRCSLDELPFDVLDILTIFLDLEDVVALRHSCSRLLRLTSEPCILKREILCGHLGVVEDLSLPASRQDCWKNLVRIGQLWRQYTVGFTSRVQAQSPGGYRSDRMVISPDSRCIAYGSRDAKLHLWDTNSKVQKFVELDGWRSDVRGLAFSPGGHYIAVNSRESLEVWDLQRCPHVSVRIGKKEVHSGCMSFSSDERRVAFDYSPTEVGVWSWQLHPTQFRLLHGHSCEIWSVAFSPCDRYVVSAARDKTVRVWDLSRDPATCVVLNHSSIYSSAKFSSDGRYVVFEETHRTFNNHETILKRWDCSGKVPKAMILPTRQYGASTRRQLRESWNVPTALRNALEFKQDEYLSAYKFSPDGRFLATSTEDLVSRIWDLSKDPPEYIILDRHERAIERIEFSPNGALLLVIDEWKVMSLYDFTPRVSVAALSNP